MKKRVLVIDNVDSFTFNLVQAIRTIGSQNTEVIVRRADEVDLAELEALEPTHLILSPGPGHPESAKGSLAVAEAFLDRIPVLGVCLGHQCLGLLAGAEVGSALEPQHGKSIRVYHDGRAPFRGMPNPFEAGRYHSLIVKEEGLSEDFEISAWSSEGEVLGIRHRRLPVHGLQVHPESVLTPSGARILNSFLGLGSDEEPSAPSPRSSEVPT